MKVRTAEVVGIQQILERKSGLRSLDVVFSRRKPLPYAIEKSADPMDQIQYALERGVAIRNVDRDSTLMRQVKAALERIFKGCFGTCVDCEEAISSKCLAAVPWAPRCIRCQEAADRERHEQDDDSEVFVNAA